MADERPNRFFVTIIARPTQSRRCAAMLSSFAQQLRQLGDIHRNPPRLIFGEPELLSTGPDAYLWLAFLSWLHPSAQVEQHRQQRCRRRSAPDARTIASELRRRNEKTRRGDLYRALTSRALSKRTFACGFISCAAVSGDESLRPVVGSNTSESGASPLMSSRLTASVMSNQKLPRVRR